jgi:hypothetical protein
LARKGHRQAPMKQELWLVRARIPCPSRHGEMSTYV